MDKLRGEQGHIGHQRHADNVHVQFERGIHSRPLDAGLREETDGTGARRLVGKESDEAQQNKRGDSHQNKGGIAM